jgi:hypothetical protein
MRKVYIAGPMAGYPDKNRASFLFAADMLEKLHGLPTASIVNPVNIPPYDHVEEECPGNQRKIGEFDKHGPGCYYRTDLFEMLQCQAAVFLPGWENSVGSRLELQVATACGIKIVFMDMKSGEVNDTLANVLKLDWWLHLEQVAPHD